MWRRDARDEDGAALVLAMLILLLLTGVAMSVLGLAVTGSRSTAVSRDYEATLHVAESAADRVILELVYDSDYTTGQTYVESTPDADRAWAVAAYEAALTNPAMANLFVNAGDGRGLGIRPVDAAGDPVNVIFAVARHNAGRAEHTRVLRMEIQQGLYAPEHALLVESLLGINGGNNAVIGGTAGNVHANANITLSGNPSISGTVSSTGAINATGPDYLPNQPAVLVPPVSALRTYELRHDYSQYSGATYTGSWFDLCPDGHVRPPAPAGGAPCSHTTSLNGGSGNFRGWSFQNAGQNVVWTLNTSTQWNGAYYVKEAEAQVSGTPSGTSLTVIAQAPSGSSQRGSIRMTGNPKFVPHVQGLALLADRDVRINGTGNSSPLDGNGLILAGEQVDVAGNGTIKGAIIAADQSALSSLVTSNSFGGSGSLTYDGTLAVPLPGMVRIAAWNEL